MEYNNPDKFDNATVQPLYYGLWSFNTFIANGTRLTQTNVTSTSNSLVKVWSGVRGNGELVVMVIHKDMSATASATVHITLPGEETRSEAGRLVRLTPGAAGVSSTSGLKFGGYTFDGTRDGVPVGESEWESVPVWGSKRGYDVTVSPVSLAILTIPTA